MSVTPQKNLAITQLRHPANGFILLQFNYLQWTSEPFCAVLPATGSAKEVGIYGSRHPGASIYLNPSLMGHQLSQKR